MLHVGLLAKLSLSLNDDILTIYCPSTHLQICKLLISSPKSFMSIHHSVFFQQQFTLWGGKMLCIKHHEVTLLLHREGPVNQCHIKWPRTQCCFKNSCKLFQLVFRCSCESFSIMARRDFLLSQGLAAHLTSVCSAHQVFGSPRLFSVLT